MSTLSIIIHYLAVSQTVHPTGYDGYYYVMQVHSWITYGYLQSPDFSLIYPVMTGVTLLVGDPIIGFRITVTMISGLLIAVLYLYLYRRAVSIGVIALACSWLIFSPTITFFLLQFPKNVLGLVFLVLFFHFVDQRKFIPGFVFLMATVMTHRMTGGLAIVAGSIYALKLVPWKWIVAAGVVVIAVSFLPGIIHITDLVRFNDQFTIVPHWTPWSFYDLYKNSLSVWWIADLLIVSVFFIATIARISLRRKEISSADWLWTFIAIIALFPFFLVGHGSAGVRFFLITPVVLILANCGASRNRPVRSRYVLTIVIVLLSASIFSWRSYTPKNFDPPNSLYESVINHLTSEFDSHDYPLVIVHKSLAEMIIFNTDFDALNWLPPEDMDPQHVLRLIHGIEYFSLTMHLDTAMTQQLVPLNSGYIAAPEYVWQTYVSNVTKTSDQKLLQLIYRSRNPMTKRPDFLNKGKIR